MLPVLVIDFGSQVTQLIVRRIRESGVYCEVVPFNQAEAAIERHVPRAIVLSGGPASVCDRGSPRAPDRVFTMGVPVLGHLLRPADDGGAIGRPRGAQQQARIRPRRDRGDGTVSAGRWRVAARRARRRLDEPWRSGDRSAVGLPCARHQRQRTLRHHRRRDAPLLRRDVPSRSRAHAARRGTAAKLHANGCGHRAGLEHEGVPCRGHPPHPRAGREKARHMRPVGRRRFIGRGPSDP